MTLLYADLPEKPSGSERPDRRRLEALIGLAAAAGAGLAGVSVVGGLLRTRRDRADQWAVSVSPRPDPAATGVERVAPTIDTPLLIGPVSEVKFDPIDDDAAALTIVESIPAPAPLPDTGTTPRTIDAVLPPIELEPIIPVDVITEPPTVPPATAPPATVPPTTVPLATAPPATVPPTTIPPPSEPTPAVRHLALTAGFNLTASMVRTLVATGLEGWVDAQLDPGSVSDPIVDEALAGFVLLDADPAELAAAGLGPTALSQIRWAGFVRPLVGERQVLDQMTSLWREFFAVHGDAADLVGLEQAIRRHALGSYFDLLDAVLATSAMRRAFALPVTPTADDLVDSSFARELLERFTLGAADLFDDADIGPLASELAAVGVAGDAVAGLCRRPETGRHIVATIAGHFLGPEIHAAVVERAEQVYEATGGDIGAVVRAVLLDGLGGAEPERTRSGELWLRAALRAVGADIVVGGEWNADDPNSIAGMLRTLEVEPGTGVQNEDADWETPAAVRARWTVARRLSGGGGAGVLVDLARTVPDRPLPATTLIDEIAEHLRMDIAGRERDALLAYLGVDHDEVVAVLDPGTAADLVALLISFPGFQRRGDRS